MNNNINNISKHLFSLLRSSVFEVPVSFSESMDFNVLLQEARDQAIVGLVTPGVRHCAELIDVSNLDQWIGISDKLCAFFVFCFQAQRELVKLFEDNDIPIVIVKGYAAAVYYPIPRLRTMGDIDFLVPMDSYEKAQILLEKYGYIKQFGTDQEESRHIGYIKNGIVYEMHWSMSSFGVDIDSFIEQGLAHADSGVIAGISFPMLPPLENGLVLLMHIRQHLLEEAYSIGLRQIVDWMMYVNRYSGTEIDGVVWDECFIALAKQYGLNKLAITVTCLCKEWLGLTNAPGWCKEADLKTAEELLDTVMASGNFGSKLEKDCVIVQQGVVLFQKDGLFKRLQSRGMTNWKAAKKWSVLRHFAWLYQIFRVIKFGLKSLVTSKKVVNQIADGKKKCELLKKLGV